MTFTFAIHHDNCKPRADSLQVNLRIKKPAFTSSNPDKYKPGIDSETRDLGEMNHPASPKSHRYPHIERSGTATVKERLPRVAKSAP